MTLIVFDENLRKTETDFHCALCDIPLLKIRPATWQLFFIPFPEHGHAIGEANKGKAGYHAVIDTPVRFEQSGQENAENKA